MNEQKLSPVVDADGHVLEPGDMYQNYIDPQYRDRAIRIEVDAKGHENLIIDNKPYQSESMRGNLGAIGGIGMDRKKLLSRGQVTYAEGSPAGGYDPKARLKVMDDEEIDIDKITLPDLPADEWRRLRGMRRASTSRSKGISSWA